MIFRISRNRRLFRKLHSGSLFDNDLLNRGENIVDNKNQFLNTVLNSPKSIKKFLIEHGKEGKSICPISFFREEDREKYLRGGNKK